MIYDIMQAEVFCDT